MKTRYKILILIGLMLFPVLLSGNFAYGLCVSGTDWNKVPCWGRMCARDEPACTDPNWWKQRWMPYYDYKGAEWMNQKRIELLDAIKTNILAEWKNLTPNGTNSNVHDYYFYMGQVPSIYGVYVDQFFADSFPPLKQIKAGMKLDELFCKSNFVLLLKHDGSPACVTHDTRIKLIERGWAQNPLYKLDNKNIIDNVKSLQEVKEFLAKYPNAYYDVDRDSWVAYYFVEGIIPKAPNYDISRTKRIIIELDSFGKPLDVGIECGGPVTLSAQSNVIELLNTPNWCFPDGSEIKPEPTKTLPPEPPFEQKTDPITKIEINFGNVTDKGLVPVTFYEVTTHAESLDDIVVWNFEFIGHSGDNRNTAWNILPNDKQVFYEIIDNNAQDTIDRIKLPENWAIPSDLHLYEMDCGLFQAVVGESAHPTSFPIKNNTSTIIAKNSWMGIYPDSNGEYSFEFASIFEHYVRFPEDSVEIISQDTRECKLTQNIENDPEGKYTEGYYTKMTFRFH